MRIVTRSEWGMNSPLGPELRLPVGKVHIHHSVTTPTADPVADARTLERIGVERFGRLSYSWMIHPNGTVLEGQGRHIGAHTENHNSSSVGIVFIGDFTSDAPTVDALDAGAELVAWLRSEGIVTADATVHGHREAKETECPGDQLMAVLSRLGGSVDGGEFLVALRAAIDAARTTTLRRGDQGEAVRTLQFLLQRKGAAELKVDGDFGEHTERVVRLVETAAGLPADGVVDPDTWAAIAP